MRKLRAGAVVLTALSLTAVSLTACGAANDNQKSSTQQGGGAVAPAPPNAAEKDAPGGEPGNTAPGGAAGPAPAEYRRDERAIIYTGDITVRVNDVDQMAARVGALADGAGGFVAGDKRGSTGDHGEAHLTLRVPADRFTSVVNEIAKMDKEESRSFSTEDVTQQVVDLDAQIASQKASVDRTRALLARAQSVGEIVSIEAELAKRESALATLEARKRRLSDLTTLSTVTVHLLKRSGTSTVAPTDDDPGFLTGLKTGWSAFVGAMTVLLAILGFVLPFLIVFAAPSAVIWWALRRRRRLPAAP